MRTKAEILQGMNLIEFVTRCKVDFKFFCERLLGLTEYGGIHKFQLEWFYLIQNNERAIIEAPSGYSKTTIVGVAYPIWIMFNYNRKKILLISKTMPQAKDNMLGQIRDYIENNELLKHLIPRDADKTWSQTQLKTSNGCSVINRPYSVNIKSYRADYILLDEIDSYEDTNIFFDYVVSRLNPGGKIVGISTPENEGRLIGLIKARKLKEYIMKKYVAIVNCKDPNNLSSGESVWPERFSLEYLMKLRVEQGEQFFQKNYMCNVKIGSEDSIFKLPHLMNCFDSVRDFKANKESKDGVVILGADFAISSGLKADFDAYVIIEKMGDYYIIKHIEMWKGIPTPAKVARIEELIHEYSVDIIVADESNIGPEPIRGLQAKGHYVIPQKFSPEERKKLIVTLKNIVEAKLLVIPRHSDNEYALDITNKLITQLTGFVEKESERTKHRLLVSTARHDDLAMSLCMAVKIGTEQVTGNFDW